MKILLIGIGRWGANHLRVLHSLPVELFVAELHPAHLDAARKLGISDSQLSNDYRSFIDKVDAAVIVTPATTHLDLCHEFLSAGKDVFVEKPITLAGADAHQLAQLAERNHRILQVGHIFRFDTASQWLKQAIGEGQFGRLQVLRGVFSGFKRPRTDSGIAFADAIHFVDLFNYFTGSVPTRVSAVMDDFLGRGSDDSTWISLEYQTGGGLTRAMIETDYFLPGKHRDVTVIGSHLSATCDYNVSQYKIKTYQNRHLKVGNEFKAQEGILNQVECSPEEPLRAELEAFIQCVETRQSPRADGWAGYDAVRVIEAAGQAARTGTAVQLVS